MSEGLGRPMNLPSLLGVYLAVNALPDAYILVDGPDCALYKSHFIHGRHDLNSTLLRISGRHRVAFTNVCARGVVKEHDEIIRRHILTLDGLAESGLTLVTALPMCSITGVDYGRVIRSLGGRLSKPAVDIPPDSLTGDWLDGYAQTLSALVRGLGFTRGRRRKGSAAVIGYLMDRNEADHLGNLAELRRMLAALSLRMDCVWLGGQKALDLRRAQEAEFIISLPYGRAAARRLAGLTGARLVETELPFGLARSQRFMRDVGEAAVKSRQAEAFIARELARAIPRLRWIIPQRFLNRRAAFMGDPYLAAGFADIAEDLGMTVDGFIIRGRKGHGGPKAAGVLYEPPASSGEVRRLQEAPLDLLVSCWCDTEWPQPRCPSMEFGFPSYRHHALFEQPFLGFNGLLAFVGRMADTLSERPASR